MEAAKKEINVEALTLPELACYIHYLCMATDRLEEDIRDIDSDEDAVSAKPKLEALKKKEDYAASRFADLLKIDVNNIALLRKELVKYEAEYNQSKKT